jgi:hypothetical protein
VDASNPLGNDGSITISGLADGTEVRVVSVRNNFDTQLEARNFPYVLFKPQTRYLRYPD